MLRHHTVEATKKNVNTKGPHSIKASTLSHQRESLLNTVSYTSVYGVSSFTLYGSEDSIYGDTHTVVVFSRFSTSDNIKYDR